MRASGGRSASVRVVLALVLTALAACTNNSPPPVASSSAASTSAPPVEEESAIVVSVDSIAGGYNPHHLADSSTVTQALSQLLLPSVFRADDEGEPELDENLMESAEVTEKDPFTVTYQIRPEAAWSDGAPIAVEDFIYLAEAMRSESGVRDPAGYQLIRDIQPGAGGKQVDVTFDEPYPGWKTLFDNLLPAHLLKDAPGGWGDALAGSFPVYGGPFAVKELDQGRGEIVLERNERYWEKPAAIDQIIVHDADQQDMVTGLRSGHDQFALTSTDASGLDLFEELDEDVEVHQVPRPDIAQVLLRPTGPVLDDDETRAGIMALLDREKLIDEGTQQGPAAGAQADAQVLAPSDEDYESTIPSSDGVHSASPEQAETLLDEAGYEREEGSWVDEDGEQLSLVVAVPGEREPYARIGEELGEQLIAAGVEVTTIDPSPRELFSSLLDEPDNGDGGDRDPEPDTGRVGADIVVGPRPVNPGDPASTLASTFGCGSAGENGDSDPETSENVGAGNSVGFCDEDLQPEIDAALTGELSLTEAVSEIGPELWDQHVALPLFQRTDTLVVGSGVAGVDPGPPLSGPFSSAVDWTRAPG